jgi:hypothetical protein
MNGYVFRIGRLDGPVFRKQLELPGPGLSGGQGVFMLGSCPFFISSLGSE